MEWTGYGPAKKRLIYGWDRLGALEVWRRRPCATLRVVLRELKPHFNLTFAVSRFILPLADCLHQRSYQDRIASKLFHADDPAIGGDGKEDTSHALDIHLARQFRILRRHADLELASVGLDLRGLGRRGRHCQGVPKQGRNQNQKCWLQETKCAD